MTDNRSLPDLLRELSAIASASPEGRVPVAADTLAAWADALEERDALIAKVVDQAKMLFVHEQSHESADAYYQIYHILLEAGRIPDEWTWEATVGKAQEEARRKRVQELRDELDSLGG